jgi:hemerythrin-like metal-binding protein
MLTIAWNDQYLLGIPMMDNQHKYLFKLFNTFFEYYVNSSFTSTNNLAELFDNLVAYTSYHFSLEERWMEGQGYPQLGEHQREHAAFSRQLAQMQRQYIGQMENVSLEVINVLHKWLVTHIQGPDSDFGDYIQQKGPAQVVEYCCGNTQRPKLMAS